MLPPREDSCSHLLRCQARLAALFVLQEKVNGRELMHDARSFLPHGIKSIGDEVHIFLILRTADSNGLIVVL